MPRLKRSRPLHCVVRSAECRSPIEGSRAWDPGARGHVLARSRRGEFGAPPDLQCLGDGVWPSLRLKTRSLLVVTCHMSVADKSCRRQVSVEDAVPASACPALRGGRRPRKTRKDRGPLSPKKYETKRCSAVGMFQDLDRERGGGGDGTRESSPHVGQARRASRTRCTTTPTPETICNVRHIRELTAEAGVNWLGRRPRSQDGGITLSEYQRQTSSRPPRPRRRSTA